MKKGSFIPVAIAQRFLTSQGAERVSEGAAQIFAERISLHGEEVARMAVRLTRHAGRKTVKAKDVELGFNTKR